MIENAPQRLIQIVIFGGRIYLGSLGTVKICPAGNMSCHTQRFLLMLPALLEFLLLLFQAVLPDPVTQRNLPLHLDRKVCHIFLRYAAAQTLNTDHSLLRLAKYPDTCQSVRELRPKYMHNIRLKILQNLLESSLQSGIIDLRRIQILREPVAPAGRALTQLHISLEISHGLLHRKGNSQLDTIPALLLRNTFQ